ncbi:glutamate-5-semialdehyde dehydrogenase [Lichenihabitans sp. Uapishka_5]|uniref:glutamate-5-semialdehyde dehydrogenase n=1 Tax=Lichenihabitans sp. Uapishka_5 TaxID=3037302 RepID=UPI0029E7E608|nr:glutamate-5-semialdehyde dehydrogenase [Lichenihabitans sp. Uapishka_5]MDX7949970.1 glutamate-5-semialdehyde dehydrogenase [Lichenihabitans sp. Uapishka_5]
MDRLKLVSDDGTDIDAVMHALGVAARAAQQAVATMPGAARQAALEAAGRLLRQDTATILAANARDMAEGERRGLSHAALDRLKLDAGRIEAMARSIAEIAALPDPVGRRLARIERPNGLVIDRVATPLGVIGIIYESRPNVTADAGALCLKAGNACILRGGSESFHSSAAIHACLVRGLDEAGLPAAAISLVPTRDRAAVGAMLAGLGGNLDVLVPRGGKALVARVKAEARVPVFAHLEGLVHIFVDRAADLDKARAIVLNSKLRRTGVCGAAETLLVDAAVAATHLGPLVQMLLDANCEVRGDAATQATDARVRPASEDDWHTEYLDSIISCRVVDGLDAAIAHIGRYGSHHTDGIVTENAAAAEAFLARVDSAIVVHNASTQFADGGEFGFGGEIGISTGRMHARGPVGVEQLTSFNYRIRGTGQTRP